MSAAQTVDAFEAAKSALTAAGVELVEMDMSLLVDTGNKLLPDMFFYAYEMPRELSRCTKYLHACNAAVKI